MLFGLIIGVLSGGKHYNNIVFRWFVWRTGSVPWDYHRFLDFAAARVLLRKIGEDYIFVHRLLLDYFASLDAIPQSSKEV